MTGAERSDGGESIVDKVKDALGNVFSGDGGSDPVDPMINPGTVGYGDQEEIARSQGAEVEHVGGLAEHDVDPEDDVLGDDESPGWLGATTTK